MLVDELYNDIEQNEETNYRFYITLKIPFYFHKMMGLRLL